mgnify:FL=1
MNNNERIAVLKTMASTFETVVALLPENLTFTIDSRSASKGTRITIHGRESRKFVRGIGGKVGRWYGERSQQRDITAEFNGIEVTAFERRSEVKRDKRAKASAAAIRSCDFKAAAERLEIKREKRAKASDTLIAGTTA